MLLYKSEITHMQVKFLQCIWDKRETKNAINKINLIRFLEGKGNITENEKSTSAC